MSSTVRFSKVVETAGRPVLHVLWGTPGSDGEFQRAIKAQRIMTIRQENVGAKKDFGLIGFSQETPAQFLIFPRTLKPFQGQRVVGINYDIFDPPPKPSGSSKTKTKTTTKAKEEAKAEAVPRVPPESQPVPASEPMPERTPSPRVPSAPPSAAEREVRKKVRAAPVASEADPPKRLHLMDTPAPEAPAGKKVPASEWDRAALLKEVKSAMKELEAGKAVLVFRRLEKLANLLKDKH